MCFWIGQYIVEQHSYLSQIKTVVIGILLQSTAMYAGVKQHWPWFVLRWVTVLYMSISADSPLDETLNRGPLALLLRRQYEFPLGLI